MNSFPHQSLSPRKIALTYGLLFGALLAVGDLLKMALVQSRIVQLVMFNLSLKHVSTYSMMLILTLTLVFWIIYFCAGFFVSRRTQRISTACIAYLWASLCHLVFGLIAVQIGPFPPRTTGTATLLLQIGLGIGLGAIGGLLGKRIAIRQPNTLTGDYQDRPFKR